MGMAASQARYLGLTARKTNVEYEGQQINQARTALSNQSASLWNQMLSLSVPTVPEITEYTTHQYSFSDGYNDYTLSNIQTVDYEEDGIKYNAQVTYYYNQDSYKGVQSRNTNPQIQSVKSPKVVNNKNFDLAYTTTAGTVNITSGTDEHGASLAGTSATVAKITDTTSDAYKDYLKANNLDALPAGTSLFSITYQDSEGDTVTRYTTNATDISIQTTTGAITVDTENINSDPYYMLGNTKAEKYVEGDDIELDAAYEQIMFDFPDLEGEEMWVYEKNGHRVFATKTELEACIASGQDAVKEDEFKISSSIDYQDPLNQYYATTISQRMEVKDYAILDDATGSGRYANIKLRDFSENFDLKSEEVTDQNSYNDAMNQYYYDVAQYEKQMTDINAKTSLIQEQDRTLELRLKQLDTEQKALTTEMDAVKGIIQKNVEATFKTFGG